MRDNFDRSLKLVRISEGGNDDDPRDPGGRTSRGITQREYDAACQLNGWPTGDVFRATDDQIVSIYHDHYWEPWCDKFPVGVDYLYFDMCVNNGSHEATLLLQRALGVDADGHIGAVTISALTNADPKRLILAISLERTRFYSSLKTFRFFGRGWLNRVDQSKKDAISMIGE